MSAVVRAFRAVRSRPRPWHNDELAEFYRVIDILGRAGLGIVPDMGVSDEGEPWFAFCRADTGEVVVHCARIDGSFVATNISLNEVFYGRELRDVVNSIMTSKHFAAATPPADKRLYLHPAAVFTAFIAAALLFSQHAHAADPNGGGGANNSPADLSATYKFLAAIKAALADAGVAGTYTDAENEPVYFGEPNSFDAPISLGALLAASLLVLPSSDPLDIQGAAATTDVSGTTPSDAPIHFSLPSFLSTLTLSDLTHDTTPPPQEGSTPGTDGGTVLNFQGIDLTPPSGQNLLLTKADFVPTTNSEPVFQASVDSSGDLHFTYIPAPSLHGATSMVMDQTTATVQQTLTPAGHVFDINEITPIALEIFTGSSSLQAADAGTPPPPPPDLHNNVDTSDPGTGNGPNAPSGSGTGNTLTSLPTPDIAPPVTDNTPDNSVLPAPSTNGPTIPGLIVMGANPTLGLELLIDYADGNHPINAPLTESALLATTLTSYAAVGALPRMVVFDSTSVTQSTFELTNGILFVNDHELGIGPTQVPTANLVMVDLTTGGSMMLLGVVEPTHAIF